MVHEVKRLKTFKFSAIQDCQNVASRQGNERGASQAADYDFSINRIGTVGSMKAQFITAM